MTAPQAPAAEKAERKAEATPVAETTHAGPVEGLAALGGLGGRMPLTGPQASHLDPARITSLQRAVGNRAVTHLLGNSAVQRAPRGGRPKSALTALMGESDIYAEPVSDRPVESMSYNDVKDEISDIERWLDKQTTSTHEENARRIRLRQLDVRLKELQTPSAPKKGKAAARTKASVTRPRSLSASLDVTRMSKREMADELDTIVAYLRTSPSKADLRKLSSVRQALEEALAGERVARNEEIRKRDLAIALRPLGGDARDQFEQVVKTIHGIRPAPDNPGVALLEPPGGGMVIPVSLEEAQGLKNEAGKLIVRYARESANLAESAYEGYRERVVHNKKQWVVHGLVKWATGVEDLDEREMLKLLNTATVLSTVTRDLVKQGNYSMALWKAFALESFAKYYTEKLGTWEAELVSGAGRWVLGLTILKEGLTLLATGGAAGLVSLKVAQGVSVVRAGVTVGGATTLAGTLGATGGSLADQAISGEGISASKTFKAARVGGGTGLAIGAAPGAGAVARQGFKVGKAASRTGNVVRSIGAEAVSGTGVNVASAALTGESIPEAIVGGIAGAPISGAGGMAVEHLAKGRRGVTTVGGAIVGSTSATASALAQGKGGAEVGQAAFIGGVGGGLSPHLEQSTIGYHERRAGSADAGVPGAGDVGFGTGIKPGTIGVDLLATKPVTVETTAPAPQKPPADGGQPISALPPPAASPPARPPLGPIDPVASRAIPEQSGKSLQLLVDQYDVVIKVRPMNQESIARLEPTRDPSGNVIEPGAMAKMDIVKAKSLNEFDELIGGPPNSRGLVGLFEPHPPPAGLRPDLHAAATERFEQRSKEWTSRDADYGQHVRDGVIRVEGGLLLVADPRMAGAQGEKFGKFRKVAGDIDIYDVTHADGTPLTADQRNELTILLRSMGIGVEHGAHEWWGRQSPDTYKQEAYEAILRQHQYKTPLIAYVPVGTPQAVWADTRITRTPRAAAPGQRVTPMREGAPSSTRLEVAPPPAVGAVGAETARTGGTAATGGPGGPAGVSHATAATDAPSGSPDLYLGRVPHSDVPEAPVGASIGRQVPYEPQDKGRFRTVGKPSAGVSESVIVVDTRTGEKHLFKPLGGETAVPTAEARGVTPGHHAPRAKAAEAAAQTLGVDTPGVQLVVINGRKGSLTKWVEGTQSLADFARDKPAEFAAMRRTPEFEQAMANVHALDYLINNLDRVQNLGNYLLQLTPDGKFMSLKPIDSELSFTTTQERAIIAQKTSGLPQTYTPDMAARIKRLHDDPQAFKDTIRPLVGELAIPGVLHRLGELYNDAVARGFITLPQAPTPVQRSPRGPRSGQRRRAHGPIVGLQRAPATGSAVNAPTRARPVAADLITEQYPYLSAEVLSARQIADVQRFLDLSERMGGFEPSEKEIPGMSHSFGTIVVPTFALLDADVYETANWGPEESFKQGLRETLLKYPVRLEMLPSGPSLRPLFKFVWGPTNKELAERGGRIHYWNLLQDAQWGQQHARIMAGKPRDRDPFEELLRSAGGQLLDARGKHVGSYWNGLWTVNITVGWELGNLSGVPDDSRGHKALLDASRGAGATITLKAPDGRLHRYRLEPSFKHWVLNPDYQRPRGPGNYLYLSDEGTQVRDAHEIQTEDGETLTRVTSGRLTGWRVPDEGIAPGHVEQFLWGAVIGDYFEDATAASTLGAIVGGISPLGWAGDIRDTYRGLTLILAGEYKQGIIDTAFAMLGFIPLAGDFAKKVLKRPAQEAATELAKATREVIQGLEKSAKRAGQSLDDFVSGTRRAMSAAPSILASPALMRLALDTDTVAEKLARENLEWATLIRHYQRLGADDIVNDLHNWRRSQIDRIRKKAAREVLGDSPDISKTTPPPTGTDDPLSDVDHSFAGPSASKMKHAFERIMNDTFPGADWRKVLKTDVFTDAERLHLFSELPASIRPAIEADLLKDTGLNAFAKMIFEGGSGDRTMELARQMGFDAGAVTLRVDELRKLARNPAEIRRLELQVDEWHGEFLKTSDPELAKKIAATQSLINAASHGAYVTPGGVAKHVTRREMAASKAGTLPGPFEALSPEMKKMAFLDDLAALEGAFRSLRDSGATADVVKDMSKYAERFLRSAGQAGVDTLALEHTFNLWRTFTRALEESRAGVAQPAAYVATQAQLLNKQIERIAAAVAKTSSTSGVSDVAVALRELGLLVKEVAVEITQGPGKEGFKKLGSRAAPSPGAQPGTERLAAKGVAAKSIDARGGVIVDERTHEFEERVLPDLYLRARAHIKASILQRIRGEAHRTDSAVTEWWDCFINSGAETILDPAAGIMLTPKAAAVDQEGAQTEIDMFLSVEPPCPYFIEVYRAGFARFVERQQGAQTQRAPVQSARLAHSSTVVVRERHDRGGRGGLTESAAPQPALIQHSAGNGAAGGYLQRAPTDTKPAPPRLKGRPKGTPVDEEPLRAPDNLIDAIDKMPALVDNIGRVVERQADRMQSKGFQPGIAQGSVSAAMIFARDAVYFFNASGVLHSVESNFDGEFDPAKPRNLPPPKFKLPPDERILVSEPKSDRTWRVWARLGKPKPTDDEDADPEIIGLNLHLTNDKSALPATLKSGELVVSVYAPGKFARLADAPQPGWKAKEGAAADSKPAETPGWAKDKYGRVQKLLAEPFEPDKEATEEEPPKGTGLGVQGTGPGGGGTSAQGVPGAQAGVQPQQGTKPAKPEPKSGKKLVKKHRAKPDKVVLWQGKHGPMLNVWKNGVPEAIPLKQGESDKELKQRVEESAGKQESTGKTLADAATETGIIGGQGGAKATLEQILEATEFTANAADYPSRMAMQGGSGAEVSPSGWATTISGAKHKFDMILDYDARHFGLANQVFARLGFIDYFWQVIDISGMDAGGSGPREKGEHESQEDFDKEMRRRARIGAYDEKRTREATTFEGLKVDVGRVASNKWEDAKEDLWASKAQGVGLVALDAAWNIGKALVDAFVAKMTEPENRQEIGFAKPGEFLIRCLANPQPDTSKPNEKQTRRATSIAVFPVRVVDVNQRALEVTRQDEKQLKQSRYLLVEMEKKLAADPKNESLATAVRVAKRELGLLQAQYDYSTVEKVGAELADYDKRIPVLEQLALGRELDTLRGDDLVIGMQLREEVQKRFAKDARAYVPWYEYQYHLHDVKEARKKKAQQKQLVDKKAGTVEPGTALRPRVTFVSEENGALVRMDMILGRAKGSSEAQPKWTLADVTTENTALSYDGAPATVPGLAGDAVAVRSAFQAFCDKAEYGRGTIAIEIPGHEALISSGTTMLMKPGEGERWRARLKSLVEIAGLVAPYVKGGQLIGRLVAVAGALEAGEKLYDRAMNDRLKANFETLTDVVAVLAPIAHGATKLADQLGKTSKGAYVLQTFAKTADVANEFMMPATFVHDVDKILRDTALGGPEKEAAIVMLFGRGLRDGVVQYVKVTRPYRAGGEPLAAGPHEQPATGGPGPQPGAPQTPGAPVPGARQPAAPVGGGAEPTVGGAAWPTSGPPATPARPAPTAREPAPRRREVHEQFDVSDVTPVEPARRKGREEASDMPADPTRPDIRLPEAEGGPRRPTEEGPEPSPADDPKRKANAEIIQAQTRADARARARAAEFAPLFFEWRDLHPAQRQARIDQLLNAHLAREGAPRINVELTDKRPGSASFRFQDWQIYMSKEQLNAKQMTPDQFAELVDNATHEARHALHHFRALRIALREGRHNPDAKIPQVIVAQARDANRRRDPRQEMSAEAYGEAKEIYEITHLAKQREAKLGPEGVLNRENVLDRKDFTSEVVQRAAKKLNDLEAQGKKGTDEYRAALDDHRLALREAQKAHDDYVGLPQETDAWRYGSAVRKATAERLGVMLRVNGAKIARDQAAAVVRDARRSGDQTAVRAATADYLAADNRVRAAQAQLEGMVSKAPKEVGGRMVTHEIPVDPALGRRTRDGGEPGRVRPGEIRLPPGDVGGEDLSSPPPGRPVDEASAAKPAQTGQPRPSARGPAGATKPAPAEARPIPAFEPEAVPRGAETAVSGAPQGQRWRGREVGADVPEEGAAPSVGTGVQYEVRSGRYKVSGEKPTEGIGAQASSILIDADGQRYLFKPVTAEQHVEAAAERGVEAGQYAPRAQAGEITAKELGIETPTVELVEIDGVKGSLTKWVEKKLPSGGTAMSLTDFLRPTKETSDSQAKERMEDLWKNENFRDAWNNIQALDFLINNVDRLHNYGNYLIEFGPSGEFARLKPIDSELAFTSTAGRAVIEKKTEFLERVTYTQEMADKIRELDGNRSAFAEKIRPLVGDAAVAGVMARLDQLVRDVNLKRPALTMAGATRP